MNLESGHADRAAVSRSTGGRAHPVMAGGRRLSKPIRAAPEHAVRAWAPPWWLLAALVCATASAGAPGDRDDPPGTGLGLRAYPFSEPYRDFLSRGTQHDYRNLGRHGYAPETVSPESFEIYDRLGNRLVRGYPLLTWRETRSDSLGLQQSAVRTNRFYDLSFNELIISQDHYKGWSLSATMGQDLRTLLTPLTLRTPQWQGMRIDGRSGRQGFTALLSRGAPDRFSAFDDRRDDSPILTYGGRYHHDLGAVASVGATLYNQHQVDVNSKRGSFISGRHPYQMAAPDEISVWVESDAPEAGHPAGVTDIVIEIEVETEDGERQRLSSSDQAVDPVIYRPSLAPVVTDVGATRTEGVLQVDGPGERIEYLFRLPPNARVVSADFTAHVVGDYRISVRQAHQFRGGTRFWPSQSNPTHTSVPGNPLYQIDFRPAEEEPHFTVARASGDPGIGTSDRVRFEYGIPSGKTLVGTDFRISAQELTADGEIVYNVEEKLFPFANDSLDVRGERATAGAWAYVFNVRKPLAVGGYEVEVGGEVYRMDPDYSGGYDSRRGGTVFFTDQGGSKAGDAFTQEFPLVEDNDDRDEIADDTFPDQGFFQKTPLGSFRGGRSGGVFPGLDEDGDLTPDNDRNRNGVGDWSEPFLFFGSDPADLVYGLDFNNNGEPDFRENDDHPDYPIRKDQKGQHLFAAVSRPLPVLDRVSVGYYRAEEIASWGEASALYARASGSWVPGRGLYLEFHDDVKLVEDTIRDDVYEWTTGDTFNPLANVYSPLAPPPPDPLAMRKSLVNTGFVEADWQLPLGLHATVHGLHVLNRQREIEGVQEADTFSEFSLVSRLEYGRKWGPLELWSGVKHALKEGRRGYAWNSESTRFLAPAVRLEYEIMPAFHLGWGMSGLPGIPMSFHDGDSERRSYDERKSVLLLRGTSRGTPEDILGGHLSIATGIEFHRREYGERDPTRDFDIAGVFVEVILGN